MNSYVSIPQRLSYSSLYLSVHVLWLAEDVMKDALRDEEVIPVRVFALTKYTREGTTGKVLLEDKGSYLTSWNDRIFLYRSNKVFQSLGPPPLPPHNSFVLEQCLNSDRR